MINKSIIPVVMICDQNFVMQTEVAMLSMKLNKKKDTAYDIFVILVDSSEEHTQHMKGLEEEDFKIHILPFTLEKYKDIKQIAHVPLASLVKFDICNMIPQYDKLLYLDGDIIVREDLQELYRMDLQDNYVAGIPHSIGIVTGEKKLNGGVLLFNAKKIREEKLQEVFVSTRLSLGERKSMDQETFHLVFGDKKVFLEPRYNVMIDKVDYEKKYYSMKDYNLFFQTEYRSREDLVRDAAIIHFTGEVKPWKYKFGRGFREWYGYYIQIFDKKALILKSRFGFWKEQYKKSGFRGLYWLMKDALLSFLGAHFQIYPDRSYGNWN